MDSVFFLRISGCMAGILLGIALLWWRRSRLPSALLSEHTAGTSFVFSGNLRETSLMDAIQFFEIGKREGILHIYCGRRKGYVTFCNGKVVDAFYRDTTGREAVFGMLALKEGDFYFEPKQVDQPHLLSDSILDIAFEWEDRMNPPPQDGS